MPDGTCYQLMALQDGAAGGMEDGVFHTALGWLRSACAGMAEGAVQARG